MSCPPIDKFRRALAIATIAHKYEATAILGWATKRLFPALEKNDREFTVDAEMLKKLHVFASCAANDERPADQKSPLERVRNVWCDVLHETTDPVPILLAARAVEDTYLQGVAYYYILERKASDDSRLSALDGTRLLIGFHRIALDYPVVDPVAAFSCTSCCYERALCIPCGTDFEPSGRTSCPSCGKTSFRCYHPTCLLPWPWIPAESSGDSWQFRCDARGSGKLNEMWRVFTVAPWPVSE